MWISSKEYERLQDDSRLKLELEKEVKRLAELISAEVKDCKIGPWCKDCQHIGCDISTIFYEESILSPWVKELTGEVQYCKKHLHEICPEFDMKG